MRKAKAWLDIYLGLKAYISDTNGIGGCIKTVPDDFIVEEIDPWGKVVPGDFSASPSTSHVEATDRYLWFILEKKGIDTISALRVIAKEIGVSYKVFSFAGLKDSKALTYQLVSTTIPYEKISKFKDRYGKISIRIIGYRPFHSRPGMLYGNRFTIIIRRIFLEKDVILNRISRIMQEINEAGGVPSYYGYQRFGTIRPNTHIIGKYLILGKFKEAVFELVAKAYPMEKDEIKEIRNYIAETEDYKKGFEMFPRALSHERTVLGHLAKKPKDYLGALRKLPLSIRKLFVEAYQAYIFNKTLSKRLLSGYSIVYPLIGDIVGIKRGNEVSGIIIASEGNLKTLKELVSRGKAVLLLDVPGYNTQAREGVQYEILKEVLDEEGVKLDNFKVKHMPEVSSRGYHRLASFLPEDFKVLRMCEDDMHSSASMTSVRFILKKGLYATVFLREIMKPSDIIESGF